MNSSFLYFLFFVPLGIPLCSAQFQFISLYKSWDCSDVPYTTLRDAGNFTIPASEIVDSLRFSGLWLVTEGDFHRTIFYSDEAAGECTSFRDLEDIVIEIPRSMTSANRKMTGIIQMQRYGDSSIKNSTTITFYTQPNFEGEKLTISSSTPSTPLDMRSYWYTGANYTWIVYTEKNYTGTATSLAPSTRVKGQGWGHTHSLDQTLYIRSIRRIDTFSIGNGAPSTLSFLSTAWSTTIFAFISTILLNRKTG